MGGHVILVSPTSLNQLGLKNNIELHSENKPFKVNKQVIGDVHSGIF